MAIEIIYSKRRTLSVTVRDGKVIVRSPFGLSDEIINNFLDKHRAWIERKVKLTQIIFDEMDKITESDIKRLREEAREYLTAKTEEYSKKMDLKYGRITITSAKTRYGSCSSKGNISYSYRLMLRPRYAIDYVVVHELAHLREMNHSKKFYEIISSVMPDYKERIKLLKSVQ